MSDERSQNSQTGTAEEPENSVEATGISRGRFLGLGVALGGAAALAACGAGTEVPEATGGLEEETTAPPGTDAAEDTPGTDAGQPENTGEQSDSSASEIVPASEVPVGESYDFRDGGQPAVLVHVSEDEFVAYSAVCTHQGCTVAYDGTQLACPCHGSTFSTSDGAPTNGPATEPLPEIPVSVEGDSVVRA